MKIEVIEQGDRIVFAISGRLTFKDVGNFTQTISGLDGKNIQLLELDLGELEYVDSLGLGMFIKVHDAGERNNFRTVIRNAKGIVLTSLKIAQFGDLFDIS